MKPYPKYKDSGVEWIGDIPEEWLSTKIKYLAIEDGTLFTDGDWIESNNIVFDDKEIRYITTGNIGEGKYKEQGFTYITEETFNELKCTEIFPGDLVISRLNPPIGRSCIIPNLGNRIVTSVDNVVLRPGKQFIKKFLMYVLSNSKYFEHTALIARGATMQRISRGLLGNIAIPVPKKPSEQKQIAKHLDYKTAKIDSLIEKKKRLIELLKEERIAVINQAVTKGLDPNVPMKDSGIEWLGEIPEHWDVKKLKQFTTKITDGEHISPNFQSEGMPFLSAKDVRERTINFDGNKFVSIEDGIKFRKRCDPVRGDVLLVSRGATIGRIGLVETDDTFCLLGSVILLKPLERGSPLLLYYVLNNSRIQEQLLLTSQSSAQQAIYLVGVSELLITIPPANEQPLIIKHIEKETTRIDSIISKTEKEIELLREYRIALISEVVTGKIDVREEKI